MRLDTRTEQRQARCAADVISVEKDTFRDELASVFRESSFGQLRGDRALVLKMSEDLADGSSAVEKRHEHRAVGGHLQRTFEWPGYFDTAGVDLPAAVLDAMNDPKAQMGRQSKPGIE